MDVHPPQNGAIGSATPWPNGSKIGIPEMNSRNWKSRLKPGAPWWFHFVSYQIATTRQLVVWSALEGYLRLIPPPPPFRDPSPSRRPPEKKKKRSSFFGGERTMVEKEMDKEPTPN